MTKLDLVLERIRKLPPDRQELIAVEMEFWLEYDSGEDLLTAEQWAEMERRMAGADDFASAAEVDGFFHRHGA
ncbi:MAG: hypothetical protein ABL883_15455 [Terricaulis sp.]